MALRVGIYNPHVSFGLSLLLFDLRFAHDFQCDKSHVVEECLHDILAHIWRCLVQVEEAMIILQEKCSFNLTMCF